MDRTSGPATEPCLSVDPESILEPCYALFSGGKDSFATAKLLQARGLLRGCIALETNICTPDWKEAATEICHQHRMPLRFFSTTDDYKRVVSKYGFPGPAQHGMFMNYLKGRAIRQAKKAIPGLVLASGVRADESDRRSFNTKPISLFEGVKVIAPLYCKTTEWVWDYVSSLGYVRPDAYSKLQISGDCLCGAFAKQGERDAISFWYRAVDRVLGSLERVFSYDHPFGLWGWGWDRAKKKRGASRIICVECGDF